MINAGIYILRNKINDKCYVEKPKGRITYSKVSVPLLGVFYSVLYVFIVEKGIKHV